MTEQVTFTVGNSWPTPNNCRRVADALDAITPARYGDILRAYADAEDARSALASSAPATVSEGATCDCESMGGRFGAHRDECPEATGVTSSDGDRGLSEERVEWRVESESLEDEFGAAEEAARRWVATCRANPDWEPVTLMRRTIRTVTGPWEVVGDE